MQFKNMFHLLNNKSGSVLVEFALIAPLLVLILGATVEISNAVYASQKVQTAAVITSASFANLDTLDPVMINDIMKLGKNVVGSLARSTQDYEAGVIVLQRLFNTNFKLYKKISGNDALLQFGFSDVQNSFSILLGGAVDNQFAQLNKLTLSETALIDNYTLTDGEQVIIVKSCLRYTTKVFTGVANSLFGSSGTILCSQTTPMRPRVVKFRFLPNGSLIP